MHIGVLDLFHFPVVREEFLKGGIVLEDGDPTQRVPGDGRGLDLTHARGQGSGERVVALPDLGEGANGDSPVAVQGKEIALFERPSNFRKERRFTPAPANRSVNQLVEVHLTSPPAPDRPLRDDETPYIINARDLHYSLALPEGACTGRGLGTAHSKSFGLMGGFSRRY